MQYHIFRNTILGMLVVIECVWCNQNVEHKEEDNSYWPNPSCLPNLNKTNECVIEDVFQTFPTDFHYHHPDDNEHGESTPSQQASSYKNIIFRCIALNYIPNNLFLVFENIDVLDLSNCGILMVTANNFNHIGASRLKHLNLERNRIVVLNDDVFRQLENLELLNLHHNEIEEIHTNAFANLKKLRWLNLAKNRLHVFEVNLLRDLISLEYFYANANHIKALPPSIFNDSPKLRSIDLGENNMSFVDRFCFGNLSKLTQLDMSRNSLVDVEIRNENVEKLVLSFNRITNFRIAAPKSRCLQLSISNNNLTNIAFIQKMKQLQILDVSTNHIRKLALYDFKGIYNLKKFDISYNQLDELNYGVFAFNRNLNSLYLDGNNLTKIKNFNGDRLKEIGLSDNPWYCDELETILNETTKNNVIIMKGLVMDRMNHINGVFCVNDTEDGEPKYRANEPWREIGAVNLILVLLIVLVSVFITYKLILFIAGHFGDHDPILNVQFISSSDLSDR